jgi:ATP-binding cassette, subfamily C, bacterial
MGVNLLFLSPTVYMMQISDRVMASGSRETLFFLTIAYAVAILTLAGLDYVRSEVLIRAGLRMDRQLAGPMMGLMLEHANRPGRGGNQRDEVLRALDTFRSFVTGSGIHAMFDLPWLPIYIFALFVVHPMVGVLSTVFMALQTLVTLGTEWLMDRPLNLSQKARGSSYGLADAALRNAEVIAGMGMKQAILAPWLRDRQVMMDYHAIASDRNALMTSVGKFLRLFVQGLVVAVGNYYVLEKAMTPGAMFAGMLLVGRASQPLDQILGTWKMTVGARDAYRRINAFFEAPSPRDTLVVLPDPTGLIILEDVGYTPPNGQRAIFSNITFTLEPGTCIGVIGPSAAGKSTLARLLVGVHRPTSGIIRLDGAEIFTWDRTDFGRYVGYLPQDIELFGGTVAQNITRFQDVVPEAVIRAARRAGAHNMIIKLPNGYETPVGDAGAILSGGQRQLVGLARAVYGNPCFVVLDEPNSNLDTDGEVALCQCLASLKQSRTTVVMISHRPGILENVDQILYMSGGDLVRVFSRDEFFSKLGQAGNISTLVAAARQGK